MRYVIQLIRWLLRFNDKASEDRVDAYSAQSAFFIIMGFIPFVMLLLILLQYTPMKKEDVMTLLRGIFPEGFHSYLSALVGSVYTKSTALLSGTVITAVWACSKAMMSISNGLNKIYDTRIKKNYFQARFRAALYIILLLISLILAMGLFVFGNLLHDYLLHYLPLVPAIATSCNGYFCWGLFHMIGAKKKYGSVQAAMNTWRDYMVSMGFGYPLGVDLPGEKRGMIPNAAYYDKNYRGSWNGLTIISISIGQGEVTATPLQIANLGATIANRGYYITPHVVKEVEDEPLDTLYTTKHYTKVSREHYQTVVEGMRSAVLGGTCRSANIPGIEVCGKTGTAQNRGKDHSAFMGFAPMNDPKIAVVVYVENGGWGATYGVPIGALIMEKYLKGELSPESEAKAAEIQNRRIDYGIHER